VLTLSCSANILSPVWLRYDTESLHTHEECRGEDHSYGSACAVALTARADWRFQRACFNTDTKKRWRMALVRSSLLANQQAKPSQLVNKTPMPMMTYLRQRIQCTRVRSATLELKRLRVLPECPFSYRRGHISLRFVERIDDLTCDQSAAATDPCP